MPDRAFDSENRMLRISFFLSAAIWLSVTKKLRTTLLTMDLLLDIIRQPLKIQFLFLNIILNSKSEKTYRNITFYIIINIVFT